MTDYKDYYEILGIDEDASQEEIKRAYREKARKYHPDRNPDDEQSEEKFKEAKEAYEVLSDPEKRKRYDSLGANWDQFDPSSFGGGKRGGAKGRGGSRGGYRVRWEDTGGTAGFSDFFEQIFGDFYSGGTGAGGRRGQQDMNIEDLFGQQFRSGMGGEGQRARRPGTARKGEDVENEIEVGLEEAFHGTRRSLRLEYPRICPECDQNPQPSCRTCQGEGYTTETKNLNVKIPRGVRQGSRIRLKGEGGFGSGGADRGDLYLRVRMKEHPIFDREEEDLYCEVPISPVEAAEGGEIDVPGIDESPSMKLPSNTQSGQQFRLEGLGMPRLNGDGRGDLYVRVRIQIPSDLSEKQKEALEVFRDYNPREKQGYL